MMAIRWNGDVVARRCDCEDHVVRFDDTLIKRPAARPFDFVPAASGKIEQQSLDPTSIVHEGAWPATYASAVSAPGREG